MSTTGTTSRSLTAGQREFLADRVRAARSAPAVTIPRLAADAEVPLSFAQERLWLLDRMSGHDHAYHVYHVLAVAGPLDERALGSALDGLIERHETLRTVVAPGENGPVQLVLPVAPAGLDVRDVSADQMDEEIRSACLEPFDLARGPVFRCRLLRRAADEHVLVLAMPHIATDGWSTTVLARDLATLYGGAAPGGAAVTYRDYAAWQREQLSGDALRTEIEHWRGALAGQPHVLDLPTDHPRPPVQQLAGADLRTEIPAEVAAGLRTLADRYDASLYAVLVAAVRALLQAHSGQDRFVLASTISGRDRPELEDVVGCFINTLALPGDICGDTDFATAIRRERDTVLTAFAHQRMPFELLVRELVAGRDAARNPLAQAFVQLDRGTGEGWSLPGLDVREMTIDGDVAKFELSFFFRETGDRLLLNVEYATALFTADTAQRIAGRLVQLLTSAVAAPEAPLRTLQLLPQAELDRLASFNRTAAPERGAEVTETLERFAVETGDRPALTYGGATLTYAQLDARVNRLANLLRGRGLGRGDLAGVFLHRGLDLPIALLAVLRTGAAYVPLNPGEPAERIALILEDAAPALVLSERGLDEQLPGDIPVLRLDECRIEADAQPATAPAVEVRPDQLAYVIFTSGSTGRPKGVGIPRSALANFLGSMARRPGMDAGDVLVAVTTPSFDIAALEMFLPLVTGGRLVVADQADTLDSVRLRGLLADSGASLLQATPATWRLLAGAPELAGIKALVGGEALTADVAGPLVSAAREVWNMYGPTETTIWSAVRRIRESDLATAGPMPIGAPIDDTTCHIIDGYGRPAPIGVPGELLIGGDGVAHGYFGRPGLTAQRFVADPFGRPGRRLYRTGDVARYLPDGDLEFLGRNDHQVKIRGFRIETGEIETQLGRHPSIDQAVVVAHEFGAGDTRLVAYLTAAEGAAVPAPEQLRRHLAGKLPDYMIPGVYEVLDAFPLTPNRKVDRKALPAPAVRAVTTGDQPPRTANERFVAEVWSGVLGAPVPGVHADFFALGGHSLLAVEAMHRLNAGRATAMPVAALLEAPTVAALAARFDAATTGTGPRPIPRVPRDGAVRPSAAQERLWFLEQLTPGSAEYHIPIELTVRGPLDVPALGSALGRLVERHESLRTKLYTDAAGELTAEIAPPAPIEVGYDDAGGDPALADRFAGAEAMRPFDLTTGPLLRGRLIRLTDAEHVLVLTVHHIAADGMSLDVLREELADGYEAAVRGTGAGDALPSIDYPDVAAWQRDTADDDDSRADLAYWRQRLEGLSPLELPLDRPRPDLRDSTGDAVRFTVPSQVTEGVERLAKSLSATPFAVLLAAYQAALGSWAGTDDVAVTTAVAGRDHPQTRDLVGMFVDTVVLRADLSGEPTFAALAGQARIRVAEALAHHHASFDRIVDEAGVRRDPSRLPLTPAHFSVQQQAAQPWRLDGLDVRRRPERIVASRHDLALGLERTADGYQGIVEYVPSLFDAASVTGFARDFTRLLQEAVADPRYRPGPFPAASGPAAAGRVPDRAAVAARPPAGTAEEMVAQLWGDVLGMPVTDAEADFFALGGHSLLAARLRLLIQQACGVDLPMHRLFTLTTVARQAQAVEEALAADLDAMSDQEIIESLEAQS